MSYSEKSLGASCRYSPLAQEDYARNAALPNGSIASSVLLDSVQAWNLAFLSFDGNLLYPHPDPHFTTHVRRTLQARRSDGTPDLVQSAPYTGLIGELLLAPAPRFVYLVRQVDVLKKLPLFVAYGQTWIDTIEKRSRICCYGEGPDIPLSDLSMAEKALRKFWQNGLNQ